MHDVQMPKFGLTMKSGEINDSEKTAFLGGNAKEFYGFDKLCECADIPNML